MVTLSTDPAPAEPAPAAAAPSRAGGPAAKARPGPIRHGLHGLRLAGEVAGSTLAKAWHDRILGLSAEAAFWQLLSLPPLLLALLGTLGYAGGWLGPAVVDRLQAHLLRLAAQVVQPAVVDQVVAPMLSEVLTHGRGGVATISFVLALWAGSSATSTFVNTITIAYGQRDLRGAVRSRLLALWLYVCTLGLGVVAAPLLVLGPGALERSAPDGWQGTASVIVHTTYWPVLAVVVFVALSALYHLATPVRLRWRRAVPGAALALVLFLLLSWGLQVYIDAIADRLLVFSTLAAPILALFYFYVIALAVLLGAELNATLEQRWPRGTKARPLDLLRERVTAARPGARDSAGQPRPQGGGSGPDPRQPEKPQTQPSGSES